MTTNNHPIIPTGKTMAVTIALLCGTLLSSHVIAETETFRITDRSSRGDWFGQSVAISNDVAIIGASEENDGATSTGTAYIYRNNNGIWSREARLMLSNRGSFDRFGWSVAVSDDVALVGTNGSGQGVAVFYEYDGSVWNETQTLQPARGDVSAFGRSVAVSEQVAIVGAPYTSIDTTKVDGAAFIFRFNGTDWQQEADLSIDVSRGRTQVGLDVAIEGDIAVVGAPSPYQPDASGSAIVYRFNGTSWTEEAELVPGDGSVNDDFGSSVSISDGLILVGSSRSDDNGENSGAAYTFRYTGSQWVQDAKLLPSDGGSFEFFGQSVALSGNTAIISAPGDDDIVNDAGSAYEFRYDGENWIQTSKLFASDATEGARLGGAVAISGDAALLGAYYADFTGAAYVYDVALDTDSDGLADTQDNCPTDWNPLQENFDGDLLGDVCDLDDDNDGLDDTIDPAPYNALISIAPLLASPAGSDIPLGADFVWPAVAGATRYAIEVQHEGVVRAYEDRISASFACSADRCRYTKSDAALEGENRWRLRSGTDTQLSDWSEWTDFSVSSANPDIDGNEPVTPGKAILGLPEFDSPFGTVMFPDIVYRWAEVAGATQYAIEIQHDNIIRGYESRLDANAVCTNGTCEYVKSDAALLGINRWRLKAMNAIGSTEWTFWVDFRAIESSANVSTAAVPAPGIPQGNVTNPVATYEWPAVAGANAYAIEIQHNGQIRAYDEVSSSIACLDNTCQYTKLDAALVGENQWRLRSGSAAGYSQWSEWRVFQMQ